MEKQCNDPKLMHCGLEKCVAADGTVEWVAAHSKARLEPQGLGLVLGLGLGLGLGEALRPTARRASSPILCPVPTATRYPNPNPNPYPGPHPKPKPCLTLSLTSASPPSLPAGTLPTRGRQVPYMEPAQPAKNAYGQSSKAVFEPQGKLNE